MKYADINKKYTAIIAEYLANGYTINTRTMGGSQGDYAHIDLTNGTEVIRILVETFHEWGKLSIEGLEIIVGRGGQRGHPELRERLLHPLEQQTRHHQPGTLL